MTLPARVAEYADADRRLSEDLQLYSRNLVKIQTKTGELKSLIWNAAQRQLHARLERQLEARGLVRAIVLKARRLGISTYVGTRYYNRTSLSTIGKRAFILTHEDPATQQLFDMVKRMNENMPRDYRPDLLAANENELDFAGQDSGYRVGTAKNVSGRGRGSTIQLFHGSEVGFWPQAHKHFAGVMKAVSLVPGTEIILESTANGPQGEFYNQWVLAEKGLSDFIPIFLPWFIDPDNARTVNSDFEPSEEEQEYRRLFRLTLEQLCWAHFENIALGGEPGKFAGIFRQENPATAAEAFQNTGGEGYIPTQAVLRARRLKLDVLRQLPRVIGVDVARGGKDRTRIIDRQGRVAGRIDETMHTDDLVQIAHRVMTLLVENPDIRKAFIDITGVGSGVYDVVRNNGFEKRVAGVNFGENAQDQSKFVNRRAEMWGRMKEWFLDPAGATIPDNDEWQRHICGPRHKHDANSRVQLESKEEMKSPKRLGFSPDVGDALGLTFAEILAIDTAEEQPQWMKEFGTEAADNDLGDWQTR